MLDEVGIIHMNGRIYDATIGRFLQADPHIDGAGSIGGYNRYSYGKNNPLNGTDPSGYGFLSKAWKKLRPFVGVIVSAVLVVAFPGAGGIASGWFLSSWYGAAALGAISGAANAAANGANLRGVLSAAAFGAASGAAFYGVGQAFEAGKVLGHLGAKTLKGFTARVLAHGFTGGVMAVAQGGKFGHGFAGAGISKGFSLGAANLTDDLFAQFAAASIAGGTVSEVTGGKFANGAQTAALAFLVNHVASTGASAVKESVQKGNELKITDRALKAKFRGFIEGQIDSDGNAEVVLSVDKMNITLTKDGWTADVAGLKGVHEFGSGLQELGVTKLGTTITLSDFSAQGFNYQLDIPDRFFGLIPTSYKGHVDPIGSLTRAIENNGMVGDTINKIRARQRLLEGI